MTLDPFGPGHLERLDRLATAHASSRALLAFYRELLTLQSEFRDRLAERTIDRGSEWPDLPAEQLLPMFPAFLQMVATHAPASLQAAAHWLEDQPASAWTLLLRAFWEENRLPETSDEAILLFFPKAFLQPYACLLAQGRIPDEISESPPRATPPRSCPVCSHPPLLSVLRPEGEGAARFLACSLCFTQWRYRRMACSACMEQDARNLPCYRSPDFPHIRVEACDSCRRYIKSIDLTVDGLAAPVVDELAAVPLDIWAAGQGYSKLELNLAGI